MHFILKITFYILIVTSVVTCKAQPKTTDAVYTYKVGDRNGIGKWFLGREIAHVMGYQAMDWLDRDSREAEENTSRLIKNMDLESEDIVADIGAGSGYHVLKMAPKVKQVYAVDIQDEMLNAIQVKLDNEHLTNVQLIHSIEESTKLPVNSVDKVLMVDVYHEFKFPLEMLASIKKALKPGGEVYLIEYRGEDPKVPIKEVHKMTEQQAKKEMRLAGFKLKKNIDNLPWQHCMIFGIDI